LDHHGGYAFIGPRSVASTDRACPGERSALLGALGLRLTLGPELLQELVIELDAAHLHSLR